MDFKELETKNEKELRALLDELREANRETRFRTSRGAEKRVRQGRELKKQIARILTRLNSL